MLNLCACYTHTRAAPAATTFINRKLHRIDIGIYSIYAKHQVADAIPLYLDAARQAYKKREFEYEAKFLVNAGACQLLIFRYQDAMGTMERARQAADRTGNVDFIASANANIASLYLQMGNFSSAAIAGERALSVLRDNHPMYSRVIIPIAQVRAEQHDLVHAEPLIRKAIDGAMRTLDLDTASWAWDYIGYRYTQEHRLEEADRALTESLRLRKTFHLADLGSSYYHLALLRSDQGRVQDAAALLNSAVLETRKLGNSTPAWNIFYARGRLLAKAGDRAGAWRNLERAVDLVRDWRSEVVANDANRTSAEAALGDLYALYIDVGNLYAADGKLEFARRTFEAAEENRATGLRALAERETGWHTKLPARYWETLASLQDAERAVLHVDTPEHRSVVASLRATLDVLEAVSGMPGGSTTVPTSQAVQKKLGPDSVLFSFQLGEKSSWLWAVNSEEVAVFPLPSRLLLTRDIHDFQNCLHRNLPCGEKRGAALYRSLFSHLPDRFTSRKRWIFSLDRDLFSLTLSALVINGDPAQPIYLGAVKALQATPGAILYSRTHNRPDFSGALLGVGDAIYNGADSRWQPTKQVKSFGSAEVGFVSSNFLLDDPHALHLARLWGAADEVRVVARAWEPPRSVILTGEEVSRQRLWAEMARKPAVVHFATHILEANDRLHTGWIALSMAENGKLDFLAPSEISIRKLDTSLVVLNGCSSGMGEILPSSGLMGLTRAWIAAGASDVLATRWPGPDEDGFFFVDFYRSLKQFPEKGPAFALLSACQNSIGRGGWRAKPQFWASYFLTGTD